VIVLAIDTCDFRGSVAVLRDQDVLKVLPHDSQEDYSTWLLPAVHECLGGCGLGMQDVEAYAVPAGPGSFTGVRVGLTTVKAWGEVYGKPILAVSRLEALAVQAPEVTPYVAAFADARRGQVFGAVYRREGKSLSRLGEEMVIAPGRFVEMAAEEVGDQRISWVSSEAGCLLTDASWKVREARGERVEIVSNVLAPWIGRIGLEQLAAGEVTDALSLDANYVRRSDAEIFWKDGAAKHGR
jgi:tRNA threonylcarbamoyladenosine biosynthesis protein TsaB